MSQTDRLLSASARMFLAEEEYISQKAEARCTRLYAETATALRALERAAKRGQDGFAATARLQQKFRRCVNAGRGYGMIQVKDVDPSTSGDLIKLRQRCNSADARDQAKVRAAIALADTRADRLSKLRLELDNYLPGGKYWMRARGREQKRACRAKAHELNKRIKMGDF